MSVDAYIARGSVYLDNKEYMLAIQDFNHVTALASRFTSAFYFNRGLAYLYLGNKEQAEADFNCRSEMKPTNINALWLLEWIGMDKQIARIQVAARLERIAMIEPEHYVAFLCRGIALGLRGKVKQGIIEIEKAIPLVTITKSTVHTDPWEPYFWQGLFCAYYYKGRYQKAVEAIEKSLELGLPPILLTPLYWQENDRRDFFEQYARPLLAQYDI